MAVLLDVRDLLVASWEISEEDARKLSSGLEPGRVDDRYLVSVVGLGRVHARVGRVPLAPFSQINVRTYALFENEPGVLVIGERSPRHKRRYVTLRIPQTVLERVHSRLSSKSGVR